MTKVLSVALVVLGFFGCKKEPPGSAEVECRGGILRSECTVKHVDGSNALQVSWKRRFLCRDRHPAIVSGYEAHLSPGETKSHLFSRRDVDGADGCEVIGTSLTDL